jgi:hypothetical protein
VDEHGRLLPTSVEDRKVRMERFDELLEEWKTWPDDDPPWHA